MKIKFQVYNRQQSQIYLISINFCFLIFKCQKNNKNNKNNKKTTAVIFAEGKCSDGKTDKN